MQRAIGRAYQRLQGAHPRRPPSRAGRAMEIFCDALLVLAAATFVAGLGLAAWSFFPAFAPFRLAAGVALVTVGPLLLLLWERLAWEPFEKVLSQLT